MTTQLKPARGHGKRISERAVLTRCLLLLNRLKQGAADKAALIDAVQRDLPEAYPASPAAQREAFKRDLQRLRRVFGVTLAYANGEYELADPGLFLNLPLSPAALEGMMTLALAFEGQPDYANVLQFIEEVARWLPASQRLSLRNPQVIVNLDILKQLDPDPISPRVWESVRRAKAQRRLIQFNYLSARYEDNKPKRFRVAPARIVYQWGHLYLLGYVLPQAGSTPATGEYIRFRLGGIQDDDALQVLPTVMGRTPASAPPRYEVRYRLLPPLGRGKVSRHFEGMQVTQREDGTTEVCGTTQDLFHAERVLLSYGQYCVVLGGRELLERMRQAVEGMHRNLREGSSGEGH